MAKIWKDDDVSLEPIKDQKIAVLGYGIQGHAQSNNMKDSGLNVIIGAKEGGSGWKKAQAEKELLNKTMSTTTPPAATLEENKETSAPAATTTPTPSVVNTKNKTTSTTADKQPKNNAHTEDTISQEHLDQLYKEALKNSKK